MKVQFRSVSDTTRTVNTNECTDTSVFPYTEVFFKSVTGNPVTIECGTGSCSRSLVEDSGETFSERDVSAEMRERCLQIAEDMRNGEYDEQVNGD